MNIEIFEALRALEKERGISMDFMLEKINKAIVTACKNNYGGNEDVTINIDEEAGTFDVSLLKTVVDDVEDPYKEISLKEALELKKDVQVGEQIGVLLNTKQFGHIAAQTARNIIRQGIKDGEKNQIAEEFESKKDSIVMALVDRIDRNTGTFILKIGKAETTLPVNEQLGLSNVKENSKIKVYISDVIVTEKGPRILVSRSHPRFVAKLIENEVPEIHDGTVDIKAVARDAGLRTKIAVMSRNPNVDPVGSCIGTQGRRISAILQELVSEKVELIEFNDRVLEFVSNALAPAKVTKVEYDRTQEKACIAYVPENQLSLAIGLKGQNARLASILTEYRIDIKSDTELANK